MWANGDQSTNAQWWPMHYGYQYPGQDANADWATRAALWAQQRQAQEDMAKHHQEYYAQNQVKPVPTVPPLPNGDGIERGSSDPPLPPGETPTLPPSIEHGVDNLEIVAMDDEPLDVSVPDQGIAMTRLDYNHGQPVPLPEVGPPPAIPGMQTFDHNHGFTPAPGTQTFGHVPAQRFDYGHQSVHTASSTPPGSSHWHDYDDDRSKHSKHFDTDRHSRHSSSRNIEPVTTHLDYASLSDIKKKSLPLWIREGLEKMEREKQKKQDHDIKKSLNSSTSSLSNIAGYDHGNVHSPVPSPEHPTQSDEEPEKIEDEKEEEEVIKPLQKTKSSKRRWSPKAASKSDSSDDEVNYKTDSEKQQELLVKMRKMLTELLLSVTNDELHSIAKESYNEALTAENKELRNSGGLNLLKEGGALGVGGYGSDSASSEEEEESEPEQRQHPAPDKDDHQDCVHDDDESHKRYSRSRSRSQESEKSRSQSNSPTDRHKQTQPKSSSSDQESERSESSKKKKRHSKHKRKDRSPQDSPKGRSKHKSRRSRSRSRTPKKHKTKRRDHSRSHSPSVSRSSRKSKKHSRSASRSPSRKHRKPSRSSSRSPRSRKHRSRKSKSSSRSPSKRTRKRSESESPHRYHDQRSSSSSSERHKEGKRRHKGRSRSRSRSSSPRHTRH